MNEDISATTLQPGNQDLSLLEARLDYSFQDRHLLTTALSHRSYVHQTKETGRPAEDNQRLEFLGDAVLSLCLSTMLYERFPEMKEGLLSKMRAGLINETALAGMARDLGVDQALLLGRGEEISGGRSKNSILADALEAILAAVYLDGGLAAAMNLVQGRWSDLVNRSPRDDFLKDFKTRFQEQAQQAFGVTPEYRPKSATGPDHARTFEVEAVLGSRTVATGRGRSKKEAEQAAARRALEAMRHHDLSEACPKFPLEPGPAASGTP